MAQSCMMKMGKQQHSHQAQDQIHPLCAVCQCTSRWPQTTRAGSASMVHSPVASVLGTTTQWGPRYVQQDASGVVMTNHAQLAG